MHISMNMAMIVRVFPSKNQESKRIYVDVADLLAGAAKFTFSSENMTLAQVQAHMNKVGSLEGEFELYIYDNKMQFKTDAIIFKPVK